MNRFRVNLHPALFDSNPENYNEQVENFTQQELDRLKAEILDDVSGKRRERIIRRQGSNSVDQQEVNDGIWTRNIIEGYGSLITALNENDYFKNKNRNEELRKIKAMYEDEVRRQYKEIVGKRSEKKFERVDQDLFDVNSPNSPANKIYTQLTGAFTVSDVNTTRVSAYEIGGNNNVDQAKASPTTTKQRVDFFAHDLPNCLWEVKDKNFVQKYLPFISKVKAPSIEEKKLITSFVKLVDKLEFTGNNEQNDKPEVLLLKAFEDFGWRTTDQEISKNLEENFNLKLSEEKDMKIFRRVLRAYLETQTTNINENKQHPIFLSILQLIKNNGGFDGTIALFADDVNNYKERQKKEGKEYKEGELIKDEDLKEFVKKLQLQDFASATRLLEKKNKEDDYFRTTPIVDILADLNNDGEVRYSDRGLTKTGLQFKNTYNMIGEEVVLKNLVEMAKLRNESLDLGIDNSVFERVGQEIRGGNTELILLLQSVIANPGIDLYSLMLYGPDAAERNEKLYEFLQRQEQPESPQDPEVQKAAEKISSRIDLSEIGKIDGVEDVITAEGLHQAVAGELYTQYVRGVGLGMRVPFDEWVKGVSLNGGFQATENGINCGLTLSYNHDFNVGNGRSISAGASVGFISIFKVGVGVSVSAAKEWLSEHGVLNKIGGSISFTEIFGVAHVGSAFGGFERDKLEGIEQQRLKIEADFRSKVIGPLLDSISGKFTEKDFDLTNPENRVQVEGVVDGYIDKLLKGDDLKKFTKEDKERLRNNTILYLLNYNKAPINSENVRNQIAIEMAKDYSYAWAEQRINDVDGRTYLARAGIGASWAWIGAMGVGVLYASVGFKRQTADMYVDVARTNTRVEALSGSEWTSDMLEKFNKSLPEKAKFKLEDNFILIPKEAASLCDININPDMRGKMNKDDQGNILLSTHTYMNLPSSYDGGATRYVKVLIGGENERGEKSVSMKEVLKNPDGWFTSGVINDLDLPGRENVFTEQGLKSVLDLLKDKNLDDEDLRNFHFNRSILEKLKKGNRYKIIIRKHTNENGKSEITADDPIIVNNGEELQLEYEKTRDLGEMMSTEAGRIADLAYKEALKVTSTRLFLISHDVENRGGIVSHKWSEYVNFANAVKNKKYKEARDIIVVMLPKMDSYINKDQGNNKVNFSAMIEVLKSITDDVELGQAMLSINNIFARVSAVKGGMDDEYHFVRWVNNREMENEMGNIIKSRAIQIKNKINSSGLQPQIKTAYTNLISFAEDYRENHSNEYNYTSKKGVTLHNAVGINLGNAISIENPLFNPEVYEGSIIDGNDLEFEGKDDLKLHALKVMANDKSLMGPILKALGIDANSNYTITNTSDGRISIDFDGKNVILGAEMKFGYFAQCVNHMLLLDNITAEVPKEGSSVSFGPSVSGDGNHGEGILRTVTRDVTSGVVIGGTVARRQSSVGSTPEHEGRPISGGPGSTPSEGGGDNGPVSGNGEI